MQRNMTLIADGYKNHMQNCNYSNYLYCMEFVYKKQYSDNIISQYHLEEPHINATGHG